MILFWFYRTYLSSNANFWKYLADGPPTPLTTRRRLKKDIIKLTEENDEIDEDSESESSEEDSSEEENIAVSDMISFDRLSFEKTLSVNL